MKKIRITLKAINQVHKFTGIAVCVFLIHLSITGIFLNHTEELGLDEKYTASPLILGLYNISIPNKEESFSVDNHFVSRFGNQVFLDNQPVFKSEVPIIGVVISNQMLVLAFKNELVLLTEEGELIEKLTTATGIPENIQKFGDLTVYYSLKPAINHGNQMMKVKSGEGQTQILMNGVTRLLCLMKRYNR